MKKLLVLFAIMMLSLNISGQIKGVNLEEAELYQSGSFSYETLYKFEDKYMILFEQDVVGYKHLVDYAYDVLLENDADIHKPDIDNSLIPSYADHFLDYSSMNTGILSGSGEIKKMYLFDGWQLFLTATKKYYGVVFSFKEDV